MSGFALTVESSDLDALKRKAQEIGDAMSGPEIARAMGLALQETIRLHFEELSADSEHHSSSQSLGAERTGFYEEAARSVQTPQVENDGVSVSIGGPAGLAQRLFGGTIEAKPGGALTIPAVAEAYGHRASDFDLRLVVFGDTGLAALVDKNADNANEGDVYYWLVRSVTQQADPTVLPTNEEMTDSAMQAGRDFIRVLEEGKAA